MVSDSGISAKKKKGKGRFKGVPNRLTIKGMLEIQDAIENRLGKSLPESVVDSLLLITKPYDAAKIKLDLMGYIYPKLQATKHSGSVEMAMDEHTQELVNSLVGWLGKLDEIK